MASKPKNSALLLRGILGPVSGTVSNLVVQKNNVVRVKSDKVKK